MQLTSGPTYADILNNYPHGASVVSLIDNDSHQVYHKIHDYGNAKAKNDKGIGANSGLGTKKAL